MSSRLFALTLCAVALTVTGCGRRGALEEPPGAPKAQLVPAPNVIAVPVKPRPYGDWPYPAEKEIFTVPAPKPKPAGPERPFILDPLL